MSYSDFTLKKAKSELQLSFIEDTDMFNDIQAIAASAELERILKRNLPLAFAINTEKARSELVIINILLELKELAENRISLFSGIDFTVDKEKGLNGYCDYIISGTPEQLYLETPVLTIVEAKNENIVSGVGQCIAEMYAAQLFNQQENTPLACLYGAVTTGNEWKFIKLEGQCVYIDSVSYYINDVGKILAILNEMVNVCQLGMEQ